jgi:2-oxoglutarate ferredoxin oxidoreductase subunit delta
MATGMVTLELDRCKGCGLCVPVCAPGILRLVDDRFNAKGYRPIEVTDMDACTGCAICAIACPDVVFTVYREKKRPRSAA